MKKELLELVRQRAWLRNIEVKLASGKASNFYFDCKRVTLHGPSLELVSLAFWNELTAQSPAPSHVAGVSVGGDPLVAGILLEAWRQKRTELGGLLVRKEKKSHGLSQGRAVDGVVASETTSVWLVEDVISTGGSSLTAAEHLRAEGYPLQGILCMIDREMGGVESLRQKLDIPVLSLLRLSEIVSG
ncbi:MAG: hypothetical protein JST16_12205 [Bdellovibrionales bacterium]|nr:hypothetical protein [Bdellovibrionales bacterium]